MIFNYWLTQEEFYNLVAISKNVDVRWWNIALEHAQLIDLRPCIGPALYDEIDQQIGTGTLTPLNETLRVQAARALANFTGYRMLEDEHLRVQNIGLAFNEDPTTRAATMAEWASIRRIYHDRAELFRKEFLHWLEANKADYPLYIGNTATSCDADGKPCGGYFSGLTTWKYNPRQY